jgi:hypothetical protein
LLKYTRNVYGKSPLNGVTFHYCYLKVYRGRGGTPSFSSLFLKTLTDGASTALASQSVVGRGLFEARVLSAIKDGAIHAVKVLVDLDHVSLTSMVLKAG